MIMPYGLAHYPNGQDHESGVSSDGIALVYSCYCRLELISLAFKNAFPAEAGAN